jgi:hypothetical protein
MSPSNSDAVGYQSRYWYWEVVVLTRKVLLSCISVFLASSSSSTTFVERYQQGFLALLVVVVFLVIHITFSPFRSQRLNLLETAGLVVGGVSIYMGYFTYFAGSTVIVSLVILSINGLWVLYLLTIVLGNNALLNRICGCFSSLTTCQRMMSGIVPRDVEMS